MSTVSGIADAVLYTGGTPGRYSKMTVNRFAVTVDLDGRRNNEKWISYINQELTDSKLAHPVKEPSRTVAGTPQKQES